MNENEIKIIDQSIYGDFLLSISVKNSNFSGKADIYCSRKEFIAFANELQKFPSSVRHIVKLEIGNDYESYDYLLVKASVEDSLGHSALFFIISNKGVGRVELKMNIEPASINTIGKQLYAWSNKGENAWTNNKEDNDFFWHN